MKKIWGIFIISFFFFFQSVELGLGAQAMFRIAVDTSGLVAAYNFNEGSGTTITDSSGLGHVGTIREATWATGKNGNALVFDGVNDWVTIADANDLDLTGAMTLEAWVNLTANTGWRAVVYKEPDVYYLYASTSANQPAVGSRIGGYRENYGPTQLAAGSWIHLAGTYDGATQRLYVNGVQVSSRAQTGNIEVGTGPLRIGGNATYGEYFSGLIDDVRIYNRALTAAEIQTDMNTSVGSGGEVVPPPTCTPNWQCSGWGACLDGTQTQTCTDLNNCGVSTNKPAESQSCTVQAPANTAPRPNAGSDTTITLPGTANLIGSATDDSLPSGSSLAYGWSKVSGAGTVTFRSATAKDTVALFSAAGSYTLRLTASDGSLSGTDDIVVAANPTVQKNIGAISPTMIGTHRVPESSGVVASRQYTNIYWMIPDSGNPTTIYAVNSSGATVKSFTVTGSTNTDWEDIALDENNNIWIADVGDNAQSRANYVLYKVPEPNPSGSLTSATSQAYRFVYPDGKKDSEGVFIWQGIPYIIQKRPSNARVYRFPELNATKTVTLDFIGEFDNIGSWITGADISRDGRRLALMNDGADYLWIVERSAQSTSVSDFFSNPTKQWRMTFSNNQGEAVGFVNGLYDVVVASESGDFWKISQSLYDIGTPPPPPPAGDTTPPVISSSGPKGTLPYGMSSTNIFVITSEAATCRYATSANISYAAMSQTFATTGSLVHGTVVFGLVNGQTVTSYVRCQDGSGNANASDHIISFSLAGAQAAKVSAAVIGDYGWAGVNEREVADLVKTWNPDFVITTGDNNYDNGGAASIDANIGQYYGGFIAPYLGTYGAGAAYNRFFPAMGNHDWGTAGAAPYLNYFTLPGKERYYDFAWGDLHFFVIDSDAKEPDGISSASVQAQWLKNELAKSRAKLQIVYFHHAPYSSSSSHGSTTALRWPFKDWGADLVLSGHDHTYERLSVGGLTYAIVGTGGKSLYPFGTPLPESLVRYNADYGALLLEYSSGVLTGKFYSHDNILIDTFTVGAPETPPPACTPNWQCDAAWSVCTSGTQTRTCSDLNNCGVTTEKPAESQICTVTPLPSTKFILNDRVETTENLNVRNLASYDGAILGTQAKGAFGVVVGGPTYGNSVWWWHINYDTGADGWSIEDYLQKARIIKNDDLIKLSTDPKVYLIENNLRRWIVDEYTFRALGYTDSQIIIVSLTELNQFPLGADLQLTCTPNWQCDAAWSVCTSGTQTRTCRDPNNCGVTTNKPAESQSCTVSPPPSNLPLLELGNLVYQGAFRVPRGSGESATFSYGGNALTYNPARDSLFMVGHRYNHQTAEISIPAPVKSAVVTDLRMATLLQPFADATEGHKRELVAITPTNPTGAYAGSVEAGGLLVSNNTLYGSMYIYYDAGAEQTRSHFRSGLDLSIPGDFQGMFKIGNAPQAGFVSGYLGLIPTEWQSAFGGPALTGNCCIPIISRTSYGPAAFVVDPSHLGVRDPVPSAPVLYYDSAHQTLGGWGVTSSVFNGTTQIGGVVFPAASRSVLFIGRQGTGTWCYGIGGTSGECYDPLDSAKGNHAYPYQNQVWAYDALDLLAVKNGAKQPWEVRPYGVWKLDLPCVAAGSARTIGGVAYDPKTQRVFVSQQCADTDCNPVVHVYQVSTAAVPPPPPAPTSLPRLDSLERQFAFRLPSITSYSPGTIAFDPNNPKEFWMVTFDNTNTGPAIEIAKFRIPATTSSSANPSDLPTAELIQGPVNPWPKIANNPNLNTQISSLLAVRDPSAPAKTRLILGAYRYYDQVLDADSQRYVIAVMDNPNDLANTPVRGFFALSGAYNRDITSGYLSLIPQEYQAQLRGDVILGSEGGTVTLVPSFKSTGPQAYVFTLADLLGPTADLTKPIPTRVLLDFPPDHEWFPGTSGLYNRYLTSSYTFLSGQKGGVIIPGMGSVAFIGHSAGLTAPANYDPNDDLGYQNGTWPICYKCMVPNPATGELVQAAGPASVTGDYTPYVWYYKLEDLQKVAAGLFKEWEPRPYAYGKLSDAQVPDAFFLRFAGGAVYEPSSGLVYVAFSHADRPTKDLEKPIIIAYKINISSTSSLSLINLAFRPHLEGRTALPVRDITLGFFGSSTGLKVAEVLIKADPFSDTILVPSTITLPKQEYDIIISMNGYLKKRVRLSPESNATFELPALPAGDFNSDNIINTLDWSGMNGKWFGADAILDINGDGIVNSLDFSILNRNWNKMGDE